MAELRGPVDHVDPRLRTFRREDWPGDGNIFAAFNRWKQARAAWLRRHSDSLALGDKVQRFRHEFTTQMSLYNPNASSWSDYE
jgi:hypothetical protein